MTKDKMTEGAKIVAECSVKHTPMPWWIETSEEHGDGRPIIIGRAETSGEPTLIADMYPDSAMNVGVPDKAEADANALYIIKAVNCFEPLREALRHVIKASDDPTNIYFLQAMNSCRKALILADGGDK